MKLKIKLKKLGNGTLLKICTERYKESSRKHQQIGHFLKKNSIVELVEKYDDGSCRVMCKVSDFTTKGRKMLVDYDEVEGFLYSTDYIVL